MPIAFKFLPVRGVDRIAYGVTVKAVVTAAGFVPSSLGLSAGQVTALTNSLTGAQDGQAAVDSAKLTQKAAVKAQTGKNAALPALVAALRDIAACAKVSTATDDELALIGVSRRPASPSKVAAPVAAPKFNLLSVVPNAINLTFRDSQSQQPRAKAPGCTSVQIAIVSGLTPAVAGEADDARMSVESRTPCQLDSTSMPAKVRLYARWATQTGLFSPWSAAIAVNVV